MARPTRPTTPVPCRCPKANHQHGTYLAYKFDGCGCPPCRAAKSARDNEYNHRTGRATAPVNAAEARAHLETLITAGMTTLVIADRSGVSVDTVRKVLNGRAKRIYRDVHDLLLAVAPERGAARSTWSPATATRRRLRGLAVIGWSASAIAAHSGLSEAWVKELRSEQAADVAKTTEALVTRITAELVRKPAPTGAGPTLTRAHATRQGWVSLFAYDDISDPDEHPNVTTLRAHRTRDETARDRMDDLVHLINSGVPAEEAVARAGYPNAKAAYSAAQHRGLPAIYTALNDAVNHQLQRNPAA